MTVTTYILYLLSLFQDFKLRLNRLTDALTKHNDLVKMYFLRIMYLFIGSHILLKCVRSLLVSNLPILDALFGYKTLCSVKKLFKKSCAGTEYIIKGNINYSCTKLTPTAMQTLPKSW